MRTLPVLLAFSLPTAALAEDDGSLLNDPDAKAQVSLHGELGFLWVAKHTVEFGESGSRIDYVKEGGQDNLFAVARLSGEVELGRHTVILLYQPLNLVTEANARRDLTVDGLTFPEGTPIRFRYGFPFYRASWLYDLAADDDLELALGLSLQIRNATISFQSLDGTLFRSNRNIGPVPILKGRWRSELGDDWFAGAEVDGFWAPIRYLNGSDNDVEGAILDASLRGGTELRSGVEVWLNLRYLGGGGVGTSNDPLAYDGGYTRNWLNTVTVTLGASVF